MQIAKWGWRDWAAMVVCGLLVLAALVAIWPGWGKAWPWLGENSSNIASWVQAFGSIAAIAAGFGIANYQLRMQRSENLAAEAARIKTARVTSLLLFGAMLDGCMRHMAVVRGSVEEECKSLSVAELEMLAAFVRRTIDTFDSTPGNALPGAGALFIVSSLRLGLAPLLHNLQQAREDAGQSESKGAPPAVLKLISDLAQAVLSTAAAGDRWVEQHINQLDVDSEYQKAKDELRSARQMLHAVHKD
ncbi:MAG: hypothetical protein ACK4OE_04135 [Acidovorax sp.]|uniref:hypothetical protein n=1 Tax=Acidovorax sp. TaxID=1872122 RepID=UPI003919121B